MTTLIHRPTSTRRNSRRGPWVTTCGVTAGNGDLSRLPAEIRLASYPADAPELVGWYLLEQVQGEQAGYAYDDEAGTCVETVVPAQAEAEADVALRERIELLRQAYRDSTHAICSLAGIEIADKLEDMEFVDARGAAMQVDFITTSVLCDNLTYTLFQLYRLDGPDAWSRI